MKMDEKTNFLKVLDKTNKTYTQEEEEEKGYLFWRGLLHLNLKPKRLNHS